MFVDTSGREFWSFHSYHKWGEGLIFPRARNLTSQMADVNVLSVHTQMPAGFTTMVWFLSLSAASSSIYDDDICHVGENFTKLVIVHTHKKENKCVPPDPSLPDVSLEFRSKLEKVTWRKNAEGRGGGMCCLAALALHLGTALTHLLKSHCVILH